MENETENVKHETISVHFGKALMHARMSAKMTQKDLAQKLNVDVIVLDHHQSDVKLPEACAIVNPNRYDDTSELNYLCAAEFVLFF